MFIKVKTFQKGRDDQGRWETGRVFGGFKLAAKRIQAAGRTVLSAAGASGGQTVRPTELSPNFVPGRICP